ncbi:MAG: hypothetical protein Q8Q09_08760 [Deltaproteobacteria bacterium]|nr:hypothetical protein [Deltaproteobacteria bacterium]
MSKRRVRLLAGLCVAWARLVYAPELCAQANAQSYPVGERATGMGGAFTALADDASGAWYNPAGLAFAQDDSVSVGADLYGVVSARYPRALGPLLDYSYDSLNIIPSTVASLVHLGEARVGPRRLRPWALAINLYNPSTYQLDRRVSSASGDTTLFVSTSDRLIVAGPSLAWRVDERLGLGLALLGTLHTHYDRVDLSDLREDGFVQFTSSLDTVSAGLGAQIGARYALRPSVSLGISVRSPTWSLFSVGESFDRTVRLRAGMPDQIQNSVRQVETRRLLPALVRMGVAYQSARGTVLAIDTSVSLPMRYEALRSRDGRTREENTLNAVCNVALGFEQALNARWGLRGGLYTDISAAGTPLVDGNRLDQVDNVGATFATTFRSGGGSSTLGLVGVLGRARVLGIDVSGGTYDPFITDGTQWRLYLVWASSTKI